MQLVDPEGEFEKRFKHWLLTNSPVHIVVITPEHTIKDIDHRLARRLGYHRPMAMQGMDFGLLLPEDLRAAHPRYVTKFFEDSRPRSLVSRSGRLFQLKRFSQPGDVVEYLDCFVSLAPYETAQCDGLCLKEYADNKQLAVAFVIFLDDFGQVGDDMRRAVDIQRYSLDEAVSGLIQSARRASGKPSAAKSAREKVRDALEEELLGNE